jgi:hypothetical protein
LINKICDYICKQRIQVKIIIHSGINEYQVINIETYNNLNYFALIAQDIIINENNPKFCLSKKGEF